ncbi:MAG TPA: heavy metal-binding domain-containing protein [Ktedonobacterales bacterium]
MFGNHEPNSPMDIKGGYRGRAFTSDLTGQEFWLVVDKGFLPMGLVLGNCIYSMGAVRNWIAGFKSNFQGEIKEYSQLMYQARELALSRMQWEADRLGADGVIGVDIKVEYLHNGEWMEVTAVGTAVRKIYDVAPAQGRFAAEVKPWVNQEK